MELLRLSNSEMQAYQRCRRKWWLDTYRGLEKRADDEAGSPFSIGNLIHDSLACYYDPTAKGDPVAFVKAAIAADLEKSPTQYDALIKEQELCVLMIEGYMEWLAETGEDQDLEILGVETIAEAKLYDGAHLISKLDAPVRRISDGMRLSLEHKSVASLTAPLPLLKLDQQLLSEHLVRFLHLIEQGATPDEAITNCSGILYNMLRKVKRTAAAKPPFYGREDITHNIYELRNHWKHVVQVAQSIQATRAILDTGADHHTVVPPTPRRECTWDCEFFKVCIMADDGSDFEGAVEALYQKGDPLQRYLGATKLTDVLKEVPA